MVWLLAALAWLVFATAPALAYLDPGAGSFVLQMILAGALAIGATAKMYWYRIKSFWQTTILRQNKPPANGQ